MMEFLQANSLIVVLIAVAAILIVIVLMSLGTADERRLQKRLAQVSEGGVIGAKPGKKGDPGQPTLKAASAQRRASKAAQGGMLGSALPNLDLLTLKLERAGLNISVSAMLMIAGALALIALLLFAMMLQLPFLVALPAALAVGIALPSYFVSSAGKKRAQRFLKDLPDAIDLIVRSVKSGLPVSEAIYAISRDLKGPAAVEFTKISDQMRIGIPLEDAFARSVKRIGLSDFAFLAISLSITQETGGNLGETLTNLSRLLRLRQQMHLKIHALTSEARASAIIVGSLPFLVVGALMVLNPDYINTLFTDPTGHKVLYFAGGSLGMGFFVMGKLVKFDFLSAIADFFANATSAELTVLGSIVIIMAAVFLVWVNLIERDHLTIRMNEMASHKRTMQRREAAAQAKANVRRPFQAQSLFNRLGSNLRRAQTEQATKTRRFLSQAGWRSTEALGIYIFICAIMPLLGVVFAFLLYNTIPALHDRPQIVKLGGLICFAFLGLKLPEWVVGWVVKKRKEKLDRALPDALDLMVVCTEAGLGLDAAFQRVSGEIGHSHPVLADELMLTSVELNILPRRQEALDNMMHRTGTSAIESVVNTLGQTERYGTPLGQSFRVLASDFREQRMLKAEAKAARLPAILTVPLVVFILPSLFAVLLGPAVIKSLKAF